MVLSSYLYHRQDPTPESWVKEPHLAHCDPDMATAAAFGRGLGVSEGQIQKVVALCWELIARKGGT